MSCIPRGSGFICPHTAYQGGLYQPPWTLLEQDGRNGLYRLVEKRRLPPEVLVLRNPDLWGIEEREAWSRHIRNGDDGLLPSEQIFQFYQTRPGAFYPQLCTGRTPDAELKFQPESVAYACRLARNQSTPGRAARQDGLPAVDEEGFYIPVPAAQAAPLGSLLSNTRVYGLLAFLEEYERAAPHQVRA